MKRLALLVLLFPILSMARLSLPGITTGSTRDAINRKFGYGFEAMPLGTYKPLGGYPGLEFGVDYHSISLSDLNDLNLVKGQSSLDFLAFTLSKGLYYDIDLRLTASFLPQNSNLQYYSGLARWKFFEDPDWFRLTAEAYLSGVSMVADIIPGTVPTIPNTSTVTTTTYSNQGSGYTFVISKPFGRIETFAGVGQVRSISRFTSAKDPDYTYAEQFNQDNSEVRTTAGGGYDWGKGQISGGIDKIEQTKFFIQTQFIFK